MKLRPYQKDAVESVFREWEGGRKRTLLVQATGTGKTIVFSEIAKRVAQQGERVLILAHRGELLDQAANKIKHTTGLDCAVEKASDTSLGTWNRITVGSVQSLMREDRLTKFKPDRFGAVVIDEAHHSLADGYLRILDYFNRARVLGVTATADRSDRKDLGKVFDSVAFEYQLPKAIKDGFLCPIEAQTVPFEIDMSAVGVSRGDFVAGQLGDALEPYLSGIADKMRELCADKRTVVFLPLVRTAKAFAEMLSERGLTAFEVDGQSTERQETLTAFDKAGAGAVLCNSMLLTEGWDCPAVDCVVVLRPTKSRSLYAQMVGRGTRLSPSTGKQKLLLLDFLWLTGRHELVRPAALFSKTEEGLAKATQAMAADGGACDLMEAAEEGEKDAQAEREEKLAKELEAARHRKAKLVDPLQYEMSICDVDLSSYEPSFGWEMDEPTSAQKKALETWGINPDGMSAGKASMMLDRLSKRRDAGLATPKQIRMLERKGFRHPGTWTKKQASSMMSRLANNRWMVPRGVDPATYEPEPEPEPKIRVEDFKFDGITVF